MINRKMASQYEGGGTLPLLTVNETLFFCENGIKIRRWDEVIFAKNHKGRWDFLNEITIYIGALKEH